MRWIRKLLGLCEHHFEIIASGYIKHSSGIGTSGDWYNCRCKKCGKMKNYNFRV